METLIIYYSKDGSTEIVSKTLAKELNAYLLKIEDLKERQGFKNKITSCIDSFREMKTTITPEKIDLTDYDLIYIGTPTWAGKPTPAIVTLIDQCNLRNKDVILFATMTGRGGQATIERMNEKVKARGARVIESFTLNTKDKNSEELSNDAETIIEILDLKMYSR